MKYLQKKGNIEDVEKKMQNLD